MSYDWKNLVQQEPRLLELEVRALATRGSRRAGWNTWSREICPRLRRLVGWFASRSSLADNAAYDAAYQHLLCCWETGKRPKGAYPAAALDEPRSSPLTPLRESSCALAALYNNSETAYAMDKTQQCFSEEELKNRESVAARRFRDARYEFSKMSLEAQVVWRTRILRKYPRLDRFVS